MTEKRKAPVPSTAPTDGEDPTPRLKLPTLSFYLLLAAVVIALTQCFALLSPILLSFVLIMLITLAVNPLVSRLRNWTGGRKRATGMLLTGVILLFALTAWAVVWPLKDTVVSLSKEFPEYWERLQKPLIKMEQQAILSEKKLQEEISAEMARDNPAPSPGEAPANRQPPGTSAAPAPVPPASVAAPKQPPPPEPTPEGGSLRSGLVSMLKGTLEQIKGVALNTTQMLVVLVTVFFGVTFTLMNPRPVFGAFFSIVPERHHAVALTIMQRITRFVPRWAGAMLISMLTIGSLFFLLMWPIFGFGDAIVLGLIACVLSAIPFLGPLLSLIPALLLAIGEGGMTPVWVLLAYGAVQALEGNVILPLVMSRGMEMHPLAVMFSMILSVTAFGVLGALVAAPLVAIVSILHEELYQKRFLPTVGPSELDQLARRALLEKPAPKT